MYSSNNDFGAGLSKAKQAVQKDTVELQQENAEIKNEEDEITRLKKDIPILDKKREEERHMLSLAETKLPEIKRKKAQTEGRLRDENQELQQAHKGSSEEMKRAGVKGAGLR